jgi:hypothetical protein
MVQRRRLFGLLLLLVFAVSCASTPMGGKVEYLTARDTFNGALANYSDRVKAMPEAQKAEVKAQFNPLWKDAAKALDSWGAIVKGISSEDAAVKIREFTAAKNALIQLGLKHFGDSLFSE